MSGYDLKEGVYESRDVTDEELWSAFDRVFSYKSKNDTSYKYGFLKSILDNLDKVDNDFKLDFNKLFSRFAEVYWDLVVKYSLKQRGGKSDRVSNIEKILLKAKKQYSMDIDMISPDIKAELIKEVIKKCKTYVVGALYEDTNRLIYSFSKQDEWIIISPRAYPFLLKNKCVIEKLNYYEWASFMEKANEDRLSEYLNAGKQLIKNNKNLSFYQSLLKILNELQ